MNYPMAVVDRRTAFIGDNRAVQHCVRGDTVSVTFDTEWNDVTELFANFVNRADGTRKTLSIRSGEPVMIPWECLRTQGELLVTFIGYIGDPRSGGTRLMTADMKYPFVVEKAEAVELVVPEATEDVLYGLTQLGYAAGEAATRANVAASRAEDAANVIGTTAVTRTEFNEKFDLLAGLIANYIGRIWFANGILYVPNELATADGDVLRVMGTYDPDTQTLWIGEVDAGTE